MADQALLQFNELNAAGIDEDRIKVGDRLTDNLRLTKVEVGRSE
jgi:hypothetical protein